MDTTKKTELLRKARLMLYGLPIGNNVPSGVPIIGNETLALHVRKRIESIAKNREEFQYLTGAVVFFLKECKGKMVERIKFNTPRKGITDEKGFLLQNKKPTYGVEKLRDHDLEQSILRDKKILEMATKQPD